MPKINNETKPTFRKNSINDMFAVYVINILGIDEIGNSMPPILTKIAEVMIYGVGLMLKIRDTVIINGIKMITARILLTTADKPTEKTQKMINKYFELPFVF